MPAKTDDDKKNAKRAFNLGKRYGGKGKPLSQEETIWLAKYKQTVGKPMPPKAIGPGPRGASPTVQVAPVLPPMEAGDSTPSLPASGDTAPPPGDAPATDAPSAHDSSGTGESTMPPPRASRPASPGVAGSSGSTGMGASAPSADQLALANMLSEAYCGFLLQAGALLRDQGFMAMPDELVGAIVKPAAFRLALKALPADADSEVVDIGIVAGSSAFTAVQVVRMKRGAKPQAVEAQPVTRLHSVPMDSAPAPAAEVFRPTPAPLEAPPVEGGDPPPKRKRTL